MMSFSTLFFLLSKLCLLELIELFEHFFSLFDNVGHVELLPFGN